MKLETKDRKRNIKTEFIVKELINARIHFDDHS